MIRELARDDLDPLLELYQQFGHDDGPPVERAVLEATWREICDSPGVLHLGVFEGGALRAAAHASITPNLTRRAHPYAVVENVVTHEAHRRKGHGRRVMEALIDACRERGCYKIMLLSGTTRPEAHRFYEKLGFDRGAKQAFLYRF
ncbi:MAG: GNAT family N-acetyltransferase [Deltaproteobacteria bacterium]|nr:GNAT family N-acetyltransferase [Deltaproteobacteria bacterium]MBW2445592.1 GNAT family N-acetyltransferase [Deltaproteobacteria bacterium]